MKSSPIGTVLCVAAAFAAVGCQSQTTGLAEEHATAIRDSVTGALASFLLFSGNAEWDSLGALYSKAPAFRFLESGAIQYGSVAEVREALEQLSSGMRISTTHQDVLIDPIAPGIAVSSMRFESTFADSTGPRFTFDGAVTILWVHEADGWRIRHGHSSVPVPRTN